MLNPSLYQPSVLMQVLLERKLANVQTRLGQIRSDDSLFCSR